MTATPATLVDITEPIALEFLHSAVVIDDRVYLRLQEDVLPPQDVPAEIITPPRRGAAASGDDAYIAAAEANVSPTEHPLDAKPLLDRFAEHGLACAVLRLDKDEVPTRTVKAAQRADIVVLDWKIHGTYGETTLQLIREIVNTRDPDRLRLIAIYTGENDLAGITDTIRAELDKLFADKYKHRVDETFAITRGPLRIAVYAKAETKLPKENAPLHARIAAPDALPDRLIREFAAMTSGLVSNVALDALACLRTNMHRILRRVHPGLDAAYLSHRALFSPPEEAEDHLVGLIASEIAMVLDESAVGRHADVSAIELWLRDQITTKKANFTEAFKLGATLDPVQTLCELLKVGVGHDSLPAQLQPLDGKKGARDLTSRFCVPDTDAERRDTEFAMLMNLRERFVTRPPDLTLGTIVARASSKDSTEYFLCVQASCSAVRLEKERAFPLLPLVPVQPQDPFDIILVEDDAVLRFRASRHPYEQKMIEFSPSTPSRTVKPQVNGSRMMFKAVNGDEYRWVGELKAEHAQRLLHELGAQQTRVGVTESEWMRRSRESSKDAKKPQPKAPPEAPKD